MKGWWCAKDSCDTIGRGLEQSPVPMLGIYAFSLAQFIDLWNSLYSWIFIIFDPQMNACINMLFSISNTALVIFPLQKRKETNQKRARTIHVIKRSVLSWPMIKLMWEWHRFWSVMNIMVCMGYNKENEL